jgi:phosphatidylglycerol:prolipoprotein diacylglycerol transferase
VFPEAYQIGPILINGYGMMIVAGVFLGFFVQRWTAPPTGLSKSETWDLSFWMLISGLLGARLFYVLFHWSRYHGRPFHEIVDYFGGGLMFQGGLITSIVVAYFIVSCRKGSFLQAGDALAPAVCLGQAVGRIGCFLNGCCHGRIAPQGFPLSVTFPNGSMAPEGIPLYPTELMESAGLFALFGFLMFKVKKKPYIQGEVLGYYLIYSGILRFLVDFFRGDDRGRNIFGMSPTALMALGIFTVGLLFHIYTKQKKSKTSSSNYQI